MVDQQQRENLGPAERIIQTLIQFKDHMVHNRVGIVTLDPTSVVGVKWEPCTHVEQEGKKNVYKLLRKGPFVKIEDGDRKIKLRGVRLGTLWQDGTVRDDGRQKVADYRKAGLFPEVAAWMYTQVAEVWKLDNEFAAKWASYAYANDQSRDLKVVLAAFLMVQSRKGDPVMDGGALAFHDDDYRDVGEAMALLVEKGKSLDAKLLLRVRSLLSLPQIAEINQTLGFGRSTRHPFLGRWPATVRKWLAYRELNPQLLEGLVKAGFKESVKELARLSGYKPNGTQFFETLRWKQVQADDGRRTLAIGKAVKAAESWAGLTETEICERIVASKPSFKVITGLLPPDGLTRAVMAAAIEAGSLSDKDIVIATPTLEALGLLEVQDVKERWQAALRAAEDQRAANVARNVKTKVAKEGLEEASDTAAQKAVEAVIKGIKPYFFIDISSSMEGAIEQAKTYIEKFLQGFPLDNTRVTVFNTVGREVKLKAASRAGVNQAFKGIRAGGGTSYGAGVMSLSQYKPKEDEDSLFIFIGDEQAQEFSNFVQDSGLRPMAFGFVKVSSPGWGDYGDAVRTTAANLGIPCFMIDEKTFEDPYAIPQTVRALVSATPVGEIARNVVAPRVSLIDQILDTKLLEKPAWAA